MLDPLEMILRQCAQAAPEPWYPSGFAQANGMKRDDLDPHLDRLRMAGLIHLTDWVQGQGQGYALTPEGKRILQSPRELAQFRAGKLNPEQAMLEQPYPSEGRITPFERGEQIRAAFLFPSPPLVSYALILINIAWFLWGIAIALQQGDKLNKFLYASTEEVLRRTGALSGEYIIEGGWGWGRLITCCFVHVGLLHLGVNMYSLWAVGPFFEQLWGRWRFLVLYLIAGLGGSCAMVISNPLIIGAGASGALWGILGAHAVWVVANRRYLPGTLASQMLRQVLIVLVINVAITYGVPNISAAAHFGGGAIGAVTALLLLGQRYGGSVLRRLAFLGVVAVPVLCVAAVAEAERFGPRWQQLRLQHIYLGASHEAEQILDARLRSLFRQKKAYSTQQVQEAVGDLGKARAVLSNAIARLQQATRLQDEHVEEDREKCIGSLEGERHDYAVMELDHFALPLIADARRRTIQAYQEQWKTLQSKEDGELRPEVIEQLIAPCTEARQQLEAAVDVLRRAGPYHDPKLERVRVNTIAEEEQRIQGWKDTEQRWRAKVKEAAPLAR